MILATRSLPVPLSPVSRTVDAGLAATRAMSDRSAVIARRDANESLQAIGPGGARAVLSHLATKTSGLQGAFDVRRDLVKIEGLVGEVIRAELHRFDGGVNARIRGQQDNQDVLIELLDLSKHADAVCVRQPIIEKHQVDAFGEFLQGGFPSLGLEDFVALGVEPLR